MWLGLRSLLCLAIAVVHETRTDMAVQMNFCLFSSQGGPFCEYAGASCTRQLRMEARRGILDCAQACCSDKSCLGVSFDSDELCYHHQQCALPGICTGTNVTTLDYYGKPGCENGGSWLEAESRCQCIEGWVGIRCERHPAGCLEMVTYKYASGLYWVDIELPSYPGLIRTMCSVMINFANTFIYFGNGQLDNGRPWSDYRDGFTGDDNNFWLGLNNIHKFTSSGFNMMSFDVLFACAGYTATIWRYLDFTVGDEASKFLMSVGSARTVSYGNFTIDYHVNTGDCFTPMKNAKFSTVDKDNDDDKASNCAAKAGTGWWFKTCNFICNPLGKNYVTSPSSKTLDKNILLTGLDFTDNRYWNLFGKIEMYFAEECKPPSKCGL